MTRTDRRTHRSCRARALVLVATLALAPRAGAQAFGLNVQSNSGPVTQHALAVGASATVNVQAIQVLPSTLAGREMVWTSSDTTIARVTRIPNGMLSATITGRRDGVAMVSATSDFGSATLRVVVGMGMSATTATTTVITPGITTSTRTTTATSASAPADRVASSTLFARPATTTATTSVGRLATTARSVAAPAGSRLTTDAASSVPVPSEPPRTAPTGFTAQAVGGGRVAFAWRRVPGAIGYLVTDTENHPVYNFADPGKPRGAWLDTAIVSTPMLAGTRGYRVAPVYMKPDMGQDVLPDESNLEFTSLNSSVATVTIPRWSGRYRVTLNGFEVVQETFDNPAEIDGKRDEVYFRGTAQEYDATGNVVGAMRELRTLTYGDINTPEWKDPANPAHRIKAGSASTLGGLMTGDKYLPVANPWVNPGTPSDQQLPLLLWEGQLNEDEGSVLVAASVWEDDAKRDPLGPERELLQALGAYVARRYPVPIRLASSTGTLPLADTRSRKAITQALLRADQAADLLQAGLGDLGLITSRYTQVVSQARDAYTTYSVTLSQQLAILLNAKDRPVGLAKRAGGGFDFSPFVLNLSFESAESLLAGDGPVGKGPGVVELRYVDSSGGGGSYVLYVQVQRVP